MFLVVLFLECVYLSMKDSKFPVMFLRTRLQLACPGDKLKSMAKSNAMT